MNNETDEYLRSLSRLDAKDQIASDLGELELCMKWHAWRAAAVLIGSLIESVLYYHIEETDCIRDTIPDFDKRNIGLSDLLQWAREHGVIDESLFRLSEPIRDYRNLIHPRVQARLKVQLSQSLVTIGHNVLLEVIRNVVAHRELIRSQRAESIVEKVIRERCGREPTKADYLVYTPILHKYGFSCGETIIARSVAMANRRVSKHEQ